MVDLVPGASGALVMLHVVVEQDKRREIVLIQCQNMVEIIAQGLG